MPTLPSFYPPNCNQGNQQYHGSFQHPLRVITPTLETVALDFRCGNMLVNSYVRTLASLLLYSTQFSHKTSINIEPHCFRDAG